MPACFVLTLFERLRRLLSRPRTDEPEKILFVKLVEMGSTVLACPAFAEAARRVGGENIYILVFAQNRALVDLLPFFRKENVIVIDDSNLLTFLRDLVRAMRRTRRSGIDTAIDLEGLTRASAVMTYLSGAVVRVGYHNFTAEGPYRGRLFTHEVNYTFQHHMSRAFLSLVRALFEPPGQVPRVKQRIPDEDLGLPVFEPEAAEQDGIRALLAPLSADGHRRRIVLLNPNCSDLLPLRRWPDEHFIALGRRLLATGGNLRVVLTGTAREREAAEALAVAIGPRERVACLAGKTTLRQLLVLYTMAEVIVSNDSGPCHFAALTPIHVVALFGPETPLLYAPLGQNITALTANLSCSPCVNMLNHRFSPCNDNKCMQAITVEEVFEATMAALRPSGAAR